MIELLALVTRLRVGRPGFDPRMVQGIFVFVTAPRLALVTAVQRIPWDLFLGVQRPLRETDHSAPSSAAVNNAWNFTSILPYASMVWWLVKHRDNFTFALLQLRPQFHSQWPEAVWRFSFDELILGFRRNAVSDLRVRLFVPWLKFEHPHYIHYLIDCLETRYEQHANGHLPKFVKNSNTSSIKRKVKSFVWR
jgi:hypothetical protein